jgi:hypothetical protein
VCVCLSRAVAHYACICMLFGRVYLLAFVRLFYQWAEDSAPALGAGRGGRAMRTRQQWAGVWPAAAGSSARTCTLEKGQRRTMSIISLKSARR